MCTSHRQHTSHHPASTRDAQQNTASQQVNQPAHRFGGRRPAGADSHHRMIVVIPLHEAHTNLTFQPVDGRMIQHHENLVGRVLIHHPVAFGAQGLTNAVGHLVRVPGDSRVQPVGEQRVELQAHKPAFRHQRAMLFDLRGGMLGHVVFREYDDLAEQRTHFRAADIEHVGDPGDIRQRHISAGRHQPVAEAGAVNEQRHAVLVTDVRDGLELRFRIQRAVFRGVRDVHHARENHVLMVAVGVECGAKVAQLAGIDQTVMLRDGEHLVAARFNRARFVHVHMT